MQRDQDKTIADDPQSQLRQELIDFWQNQPQVMEALSLSNRQQRRLRRKIANPASYEQDDTLKEQFTPLKRWERNSLARGVLDIILLKMQGRLLVHINQLPGLIKTATMEKLQEYASHMLAREEHIAENRDQLSRNELREHRPFPLIFKYIWRKVISRQLSKPRKKPYTLDSSYAKSLGMTSKDAIFPDLHTDLLVSALKSVPLKSRNKLADKVLLEVLNTLGTYTSQRMSVSPFDIAQEYDGLGKNMKRNIESGLAGFFAARSGLVNKFGDPSNPEAALKQANKYYESLTKAEFLKGYPSKKVGGTSTLVHPKMKEALDNSEKYIKGQEGWLDEVLATTDKYWSTNIRENRNSPQRLSQHSFGMAIDINPENNPNLAAMSKSNWIYIEEMLDQPLFKFDDILKQTIRDGDIPEDSMVAIEKIRAQSDAIKDLFENEANLRMRLIEILQVKGLKLSDDKLNKLLDIARNLIGMPRRKKKDKKAYKLIEKKLIDLIFTDLWAQNSMKEVEELHGPEQDVTPILLKLLRRRIKKQIHLDVSKDIIVEQIINPLDKVSRQARKVKLRGLFQKSLVTKLRTLTILERKTIADKVVKQL